MIYRIEGLCKYYGKKKVLDNFSYEFKPGLYILSGENGSGKSTLIKIIANIIYPSYVKNKTKSINISYLPEHIELSNGSVKAFLRSIKRLYHLKFNIRDTIKLWQLEDKRMRDLSQGNRKKVLLIGAITKKSDIYLFDEPTNGLDQYTIELFVSKLKKIIVDKIVIISTHEMEYFYELSPEVILFE